MIRTLCSLSLAAATLFAFGANAEEAAKTPKKNATTEERVERMLGLMKTRLDLTDEQAAAIRPEAQKLFGALEKLREEQPERSLRAARKLRKEIKPLRESFDATLKATLTEEQRAKHEASREELRKKGKKALREGKTLDDLEL